MSPDGFRFRDQMFSRLSDLFRWFKEHFRDPIPGQSTPGTPHGAMTSRIPYNGTTPGVNGKFYDIKYKILNHYDNFCYIEIYFYIIIFIFFQE